MQVQGVELEVDGVMARGGASCGRGDTQDQIHTADPWDGRQLGADLVGGKRRGQIDGDPVRAATEDLRLAAVDAGGE